VFLREARLLLGGSSDSGISGDEDVNRGSGWTPRVECVKGRPPVEETVEE